MVEYAIVFGERESPQHLKTKWRRSQVVRQRSAKPLFISSILIAASITLNQAHNSNIALIIR